MKNLYLCLFMVFSSSAFSVNIDDIRVNDNYRRDLVDLSYRMDYNGRMVHPLNKIRAYFGLPELVENKSLRSASINHAFYLAEKNSIDHYQQKGDKKFTGETPLDRAKYTGYTKDVYFAKVGEVVATYNGKGGDDLQNFLMAIYHRFTILDPSFDEYGEVKINNKNKNIVQMKLGTTNEKHQMKYINYPVDGQINIQTWFYPHQEMPNPMPGYDKVGYPISFQVSSENSLNINDFILLDSKKNKINGKILDQFNDNHVTKSQFAFIPYKELKNNETYTVYIQGKIDDKKFNKTWEFTTESEKIPTLRTEKPFYFPNEKIRIDYDNIKANNVKIEIESLNSNKVLVELDKNKNTWGYNEMTALKGCKVKSGCETIFSLKLPDGKVYQKSFKIMP